MLERYTGSAPKAFQKQIILTNFDYYLERFHRLCGDERTQGSAMAAVHSSEKGVSIVDFSIGSPTAALIIELLSVLDPKAVLLLGMCGGLHRSVKVGDFILPTAAIRDEGASQHFMPMRVPALPTFKIQKFVSQIIVEEGLDYRTGVVPPQITAFGNLMNASRRSCTRSGPSPSRWKLLHCLLQDLPVKCRLARCSWYLICLSRRGGSRPSDPLRLYLGILRTCTWRSDSSR
jgi:hypothetical protein